MHFDVVLWATIYLKFRKVSPKESMEPCKCLERILGADAVVEIVRPSVTEDSPASTRCRPDQIGIAGISYQKILKLDLEMFPYKIQMIQTLLPKDTHMFEKLFFFYILQFFSGHQ